MRVRRARDSALAVSGPSRLTGSRRHGSTRHASAWWLVRVTHACKAVATHMQMHSDHSLPRRARVTYNP